MKLYQIIFPILIGALIGYCTNYIAIKMLFRPRKPLYIGKWKVPMTPGVIPKNKARLANAVGNAVSSKLLTNEDILDGIKNSGIKEKIASSAASSIVNNESSINELTNGLISEDSMENTLENVSDILGEKIVEGIKKMDLTAIISEMIQSSFGSLLSNPMVSMFLGGLSMDSISERIGRAINKYLDENGKEKVVPMVRRELDNVLEQPIGISLALIYIDEEMIRRILETVLDYFIENKVMDLIRCINVKQIVEAKINDMDVKDLEDLVMSVMKHELQTVVNLGALIGAVIGAVNIFI